MTNDIITLAHGAGGRKSAELIRDLFLRYFGNPVLDQLGDSALLRSIPDRIAFTTDSFVVNPLFFPGGSLGRLAVCGSVNDLAAAGAYPVALSAAFIIEEGLPYSILERLVMDMKDASDEAGISIVTGDTKVVPRGTADKIFITTSGIGILPEGVQPPSPDRATPGDAVILSGSVGDHGMAVMMCREGMHFTSEIRSDCAPLHRLTASLLEAVPDTHCLRDPTRGGLAAVIKEIALQSGVCIEIEEKAVPVNEDTQTACELLGIDPMHVANEGKMVAIVPGDKVGEALSAMKADPYGRDAVLIGRVEAQPVGRVHIRTLLGSVRVIDMPSGDLLPRIC